MRSLALFAVLAHATVALALEPPPMPRDVLAEFRGEVDPATGMVTLTDLHSPHFEVLADGPASYLPGTEMLYLDIVLVPMLSDTYFDDLVLVFPELRTLHDDPQRLVMLELGVNAAYEYVLGIGAVAGSGYLRIELPFRGIAADEFVPAKLGPFTFRAQLRGRVDSLRDVGPSAVATVGPGIPLDLRLPGVAFASARDLSQPGPAFVGSATFSLQRAAGNVLEERLAAFEPLLARGPIVRLAVTDIPNVAADFVTLGLHVPPEVQRAVAAGGELLVLEFRGTRSPAMLYWARLHPWIPPEDVVAGWVSVWAFLGNLQFGDPAAGTGHTYYTLVVVEP